MAAFRPSDFQPRIGLQLGLTDPVCGLNMGDTAEVLAREFEISRELQDSFALESHARAVAAQEKWIAKRAPQPRERHAHRGLADVHALRRTRDAAIGHQRIEAAQQPEIDRLDAVFHRFTAVRYSAGFVSSAAFGISNGFTMRLIIAM